MKPFKGGYFRNWNNWLINDPKAYTKAGNMRSPGYAREIKWIAESWEELGCNVVVRSFDNRGITSNNHRELRKIKKFN